MARDSTPYSEMSASRPHKTYAGHDVSTPEEGFYRFRLGGGTVWGGVRIWYGPPHDPVTGEEMDRSHRWQARFNDEQVDLDRVWPACVGNPITEIDYNRYCQRVEWARRHAPDSAYAERGRKIDLLSTNSPLPF